MKHLTLVTSDYAPRLPFNHCCLIICFLSLFPSACCINLFSLVSFLIRKLFDLDHFYFIFVQCLLWEQSASSAEISDDGSKVRLILRCYEAACKGYLEWTSWGEDVPSTPFSSPCCPFPQLCSSELKAMSEHAALLFPFPFPFPSLCRSL